MPLLPAGVLADMKAVVESSLADSITINRTGITVPCRIDLDTAEAKVKGLPFFFKAPRWQITMPAGTDIEIGDEGTSPGNGTYSVLEVEDPITYPIQLVAQTILTSIAMNPLATAVVNARVTFQRANANGGYDVTPAAPGTIGVYVDTFRDMEELGMFGAQVAFQVFFPLTTAINGIRIQAGDQIVWSELRQGFATLERPARFFGPVAYSSALFREVD